MSQADLESLPGVGPATADKLTENGYESFQSIAVASPGELSNEADLGESTASDVIQASREQAEIGGFESAVEVRERRAELGKISMRVDELDELLGGGINTQSITEIYGEFGSGKSQVTHQLAVNVQLAEEHGGLNQGAIFIDTEDTFRPGRIEQMVAGLSVEEREGIIDARDLDVDDPESDEGLAAVQESVLDRIKVAKAFNSNHQILLAEQALETAEEADYDIGLLLVDSLTAHFRAEYVGRGQLAERQQKLNTHIHDITRFTELQNAAGFVTNQVSADPDNFFGDPTNPIGGHILGHASTVRLYLKKSKGTKRIVSLEDAPDLPDGEAVVRVEDAGIVPE